MKNFCPYLGLLKDPKTCTRYPHNGNACYQASPPQLIALDYQSNLCLTPKHTQCDGFSKGWKDGFPPKQRNKNIRRKDDKIRNLRIFGVGLLSTFLVLALFFTLSNLQPAPIATRECAITFTSITRTLIAVYTKASTSTVSPAIPQTKTTTLTMLPTPTSMPETNPTTTPGPGLLTPIVVEEHEFIVYQVLDGDSLLLLSNLYNTTIEVLETINDFSIRPLWPGDIIILCKGCMDAQNVPQLQAHYLERESSLKELADQYEVTVEQLKYWNNLGDNDMVESERWIILP